MVSQVRPVHISLLQLLQSLNDELKYLLQLLLNSSKMPFDHARMLACCVL